MKSDEIELEKLRRRVERGDRRALARLLSLVEEDFTRVLPFLARRKRRRAPRFGITGPPGAGKSTLVNGCIDLMKRDSKVAVLAVDPSSPFSGGALLGDRVRMGAHFNDDRVFIRSMGSRGQGGGIAAATGAMARVFELAGYGTILIETVGVGQTELDIMNLADATAVVLVPESGDVIQTMKAGILEIADCFVVNKADRPGADELALELRALAEQDSRPRQVFKTVAISQGGVAELCAHLRALALGASPHRRSAQLKGELRSMLLWQAQKTIDRRLAGLEVKDPYASFKLLQRRLFR